jgi:hypothetical protein
MKLNVQTRLNLENNVIELTKKLNTENGLDHNSSVALIAQELTLSIIDDETKVKRLSIEEIEEIESDVEFEDIDVNDVYPSQIQFAIDIYKMFDEYDTVIAKAPMQFGKTGSIHYLANALFRHELKDGENIIFMTSMSDTALLIQNKNSLQTKKYIDENGKRFSSNLLVLKMNPDFRDNHEFYLKEYNVKVIIFDECDYGSGNNSLFNKSFFNKIKKLEIDVKLLLVSATPYCALNAVYNGELDAGIVEAKVPSNYFGVNKILQYGLVTDINDIDGDGSPYNIISRENKGFNLSKEFIDDLDWFQNQEGGGLAIVRAKNTNDAKLIQALTTAHYKNSFDTLSDVDDEFEAIAIGVKCTSIKDMLGNDNVFLRNKIISKGGKILLVVVNALSAGKDLGDLKSYVRLIVETRKNAIANGSQGLVGRICGYHKNRNIRVVASLSILRNYGQLEYDAEVMKDFYFIDETVKLGLDLSTQLKKGSKYTEKLKYHQEVYGPFSVKDIENETPNLKNIFSENNGEFGNWEDVKTTIKEGKILRSKDNPINTQRRSKYNVDKRIFDTIWTECKNGTVDFGNRFHRFRAEGNSDSRLRIKTGIIFNDEHIDKLFYVVKRLNDGVVETTRATVKNKSCYIKK